MVRKRSGIYISMTDWSSATAFLSIDASQIKTRVIWTVQMTSETLRGTKNCNTFPHGSEKLRKRFAQRLERYITDTIAIGILAMELKTCRSRMDVMGGYSIRMARQAWAAFAPHREIHSIISDTNGNTPHWPCPDYWQCIIWWEAVRGWQFCHEVWQWRVIQSRIVGLLKRNSQEKRSDRKGRLMTRFFPVIALSILFFRGYRGMVPILPSRQAGRKISHGNGVSG